MAKERERPVVDGPGGNDGDLAPVVVEDPLGGVGEGQPAELRLEVEADGRIFDRDIQQGRWAVAR